MWVYREKDKGWFKKSDDLTRNKYDFMKRELQEVRFYSKCLSGATYLSVNNLTDIYRALDEYSPVNWYITGSAYEKTLIPSDFPHHKSIDENYPKYNSEYGFSIKNKFTPTRLIDDQVKNFVYVDVATTSFIDDITTFSGSIDGVRLKEGHRVLIKNQITYQTLPVEVDPSEFFLSEFTVENNYGTTIEYSYYNSENGIYLYTGGSLVLTDDLSVYDDALHRSVSVKLGAVNAGTQWHLDRLHNGYYPIENENKYFYQGHNYVLRNRVDYNNLYEINYNDIVVYPAEDYDTVFKIKERLISVGEFGVILLNQEGVSNIVYNKYKENLKSIAEAGKNYWICGDNTTLLRMDKLSLEISGYEFDDIRTHFTGVDFHDELRGVVVGKYNIIYTTENGGLSWNRVQIDEFAAFNYTNVKYYTDDRVFISGESGVFIELYREFDDWAVYKRRINTFQNEEELILVDDINCICVERNVDGEDWLLMSASDNKVISYNINKDIFYFIYNYVDHGDIMAIGTLNDKIYLSTKDFGVIYNDLDLFFPVVIENFPEVGEERVGYIYIVGEIAYKWDGNDFVEVGNTTDFEDPLDYNIITITEDYYIDNQLNINAYYEYDGKLFICGNNSLLKEMDGADIDTSFLDRYKPSMLFMDYDVASKLNFFDDQGEYILPIPTGFTLPEENEDLVDITGDDWGLVKHFNINYPDRDPSVRPVSLEITLEVADANTFWENTVINLKSANSGRVINVKRNLISSAATGLITFTLDIDGNSSRDSNSNIIGDYPYVLGLGSNPYISNTVSYNEFFGNNIMGDYIISSNNSQVKFISYQVNYSDPNSVNIIGQDGDYIEFIADKNWLEYSKDILSGYNTKFRKGEEILPVVFHNVALVDGILKVSDAGNAVKGFEQDDVFLFEIEGVEDAVYIFKGKIGNNLTFKVDYNEDILAIIAEKGVKITNLNLYGSEIETLVERFNKHIISEAYYAYIEDNKFLIKGVFNNKSAYYDLSMKIEYGSFEDGDGEFFLEYKDSFNDFGFVPDYNILDFLGNIDSDLFYGNKEYFAMPILEGLPCMGSGDFGDDNIYFDYSDITHPRNKIFFGKNLKKEWDLIFVNTFVDVNFYYQSETFNYERRFIYKKYKGELDGKEAYIIEFERGLDIEAGEQPLFIDIKSRRKLSEISEDLREVNNIHRHLDKKLNFRMSTDSYTKILLSDFDTRNNISSVVYTDYKNELSMNVLKVDRAVEISINNTVPGNTPDYEGKLVIICDKEHGLVENTGVVLRFTGGEHSSETLNQKYGGYHIVNIIDSHTFWVDVDFDYHALNNDFGIVSYYSNDIFMNYSTVDIIDTGVDYKPKNAILVRENNINLSGGYTSLVDIDFNRYRFRLIDGLTIEDLDKKFAWILEAEIEDALIGLKDDSILWYEGFWECGRWFGGTWLSGTWISGDWYNGTWLSREVINNKISGEYSSKPNITMSIWQSGRWYDGTWESGRWYDGRWYGGEWLDGEWLGGTWNNGTWQNGLFSSGIFIDGTWNGGIFNCDNGASYWINGIWNGGDFENGIWYNGVFDQKKGRSRFGINAYNSRTAMWFGGTWINGEFYSSSENSDSHIYGIWYTGIWLGGTWKSGVSYNINFNGSTWESGILEDIQIVAIGSNYITLNGKFTFNIGDKITLISDNSVYSDVGTVDEPHEYTVVSSYTDHINKRTQLVLDLSMRNFPVSPDEENRDINVVSVFNNALWESGIFTNGVFNGGIFNGGIWYNGRFNSGRWMR